MADEKNTGTPVLVPEWQLSSVFPSFESNEYVSACGRLTYLLEKLDALSSCCPEEDSVFTEKNNDSVSETINWFETFVSLNDEYLSLAETIESYCYASYSVNTDSPEALAALSRSEEIRRPYDGIFVKLLDRIKRREKTLMDICLRNESFSGYKKYIEELLFRRAKLMSPEEEDLAADLARFDADAWGRLQDQLTGTAGCVWDAETGERKTLVELRALAYSGDRAVREKAFKLELETCRSISLPVAASLNAVKGISASLNKRRGWAGFSGDSGEAYTRGGVKSGAASLAGCGSLEKSAWQGRVSRTALSALLAAMEDVVPDFARYLNLKAEILGVGKCAFYDLFAPIHSGTSALKEYSWDEACRKVIECFSSFSQDMADFAEKAFKSGWVDGKMRPGKIGGAYMTAFPYVKESRVMCNFDGTFNSVMTLAHELGHAYHFEIMKNLPAREQELPMTLAETASIFAETLVFNSHLDSVPDGEKLTLIEMNIQDGCQIICDILSRFYFERAVFDECGKGSLVSGDFCRIMTDCQKKAYGGALDENALHPYMWVVKCHYYSADLAFYNFPYAFGQLFSFALFSRFKNEGGKFSEVYKKLLLDTGRNSAAEIASSAGFNIEEPDFWKQGTRFFKDEIAVFEKLFHNMVKTGRIKDHAKGIQK